MFAVFCVFKASLAGCLTQDSIQSNPEILFVSDPCLTSVGRRQDCLLGVETELTGLIEPRSSRHHVLSLFSMVAILLESLRSLFVSPAASCT